MNLAGLQWRTFAYHWRAHVAVVLAVMVGTATLTGALLVGDSLRGSLREAALARLGNVSYAVQTPRFFRQQLADELNAPEADRPATERVAPVILTPATVTAADTQATVHGATLLAGDERFWRLASTAPRPQPPLSLPDDEHVLLNQPLADDLRVRIGDDVLLRVARPAAISGSHCRFCSSVPQRQIANIASDPCTDPIERRPESPASSSCMMSPYATFESPAHP